MNPEYDAYEPDLPSRYVPELCKDGFYRCESPEQAIRRRWIDFYREDQFGVDRGVPNAVSRRSLSADLIHRICYVLPRYETNCSEHRFAQHVCNDIMRHFRFWPLEWFGDYVESIDAAIEQMPRRCRQYGAVLKRTRDYVRELPELCRDPDQRVISLKPIRFVDVDDDRQQRIFREMLERTATSGEIRRGLSVVVDVDKGRGAITRKVFSK